MDKLIIIGFIVGALILALIIKKISFKNKIIIQLAESLE